MKLWRGLLLLALLLAASITLWLGVLFFADLHEICSTDSWVRYSRTCGYGAVGRDAD